MTTYQKIICQRQEEFLEKESERYFAQKARLDSWSWLKKKLLGNVYRQLRQDMEDLHKHQAAMITNLAKQLMEGTFND